MQDQLDLPLLDLWGGSGSWWGARGRPCEQEVSKERKRRG